MIFSWLKLLRSPHLVSLPPSLPPLPLSSPPLPFCHSHHAPSPPHTQAARKLVDVNAELLLGAGFIPPLPPPNRSELQKQVMSNIAFREFMELTPEVRGGGRCR